MYFKATRKSSCEEETKRLSIARPKPIQTKNLIDFDQLETVFSVSLFCMENGYENESDALLKAAFAAFPDRDYCVMTLQNNMGTMPLIKNFIAIPNRPGKSTTHSMYLSNRYGILENVTVRHVDVKDTPMIETLVAHSHKKEEILKFLNNDFSNAGARRKSTCK